MTSPLLALFTRSLQQDTRSKGTYWTRIGLGGFIFFVLLAIGATGNWVGAPGRNFFISIVILQTIAITFIGLSYFASAITEEKEEETLGLLRMTNLSPLSILLGKSTSRLGAALLLLAAQFPFMVIAVTLGGVSLRQILATYCTLAAYIFLLCNVALLGSVLARRTAGATVFTVLFVGFLLVAGPLIRVLHQLLLKMKVASNLDQLGATLWELTPIARLKEVFSTGFAEQPAGWQVGSNAAVGLGCFLLAWLAFERFCDPTSGASVVEAAPVRGASGGRSGRPTRPVSRALTWKDYHFQHGGRRGFWIRAVAYGTSAVAAGAVQFWAPAGYVPLAGAITSVMSFAFTIDIAAMAARIFRSEIRDQTLSALATLPLTIRQLSGQKVRACLAMAAPGAICMIVGNVLSLAGFQKMAATVQFGVTVTNGGEKMWWMMIAQTFSSWISLALLVYVVAWLSLSMERGSLPVGYVAAHAFQALVSILSMVAVGLISYGFSSSNLAARSMDYILFSPLLGGAAGIVVIIILHQVILHRLDRLVGEN